MFLSLVHIERVIIISIIEYIIHQMAPIRHMCNSFLHMSNRFYLM